MRQPVKMLTTPFAALTVFSDIFAHRLHDIVSFFKIIFFCRKNSTPRREARPADNAYGVILNITPVGEAATRRLVTVTALSAFVMVCCCAVTFAASLAASSLPLPGKYRFLSIRQNRYHNLRNCSDSLLPYK